MNYFIVNRPANLITGTVSTSHTPESTKLRLFVPANDKAMRLYLSWLGKNPGICPDIGDIAAKSRHVLDCLTGARASKAKPRTENLNQRYREPTPAKAPSREQQVRDFIALHPGACSHDLHEQFQCGTLVAEAYLAKHQSAGMRPVAP